MFYPQLGPDPVVPNLPGCATQTFATTQRTNWHYACAAALIEGRIVPDFSGAVPFRRDRFMSGPEDIVWVSDGPVTQGEPLPGVPTSGHGGRRFAPNHLSNRRAGTVAAPPLPTPRLWPASTRPWSERPFGKAPIGTFLCPAPARIPTRPPNDSMLN